MKSKTDSNRRSINKRKRKNLWLKYSVVFVLWLWSKKKKKKRITFHIFLFLMFFGFCTFFSLLFHFDIFVFLFMIESFIFISTTNQSDAFQRWRIKLYGTKYLFDVFSFLFCSLFVASMMRRMRFVFFCVYGERNCFLLYFSYFSVYFWQTNLNHS